MAPETLRHIIARLSNFRVIKGVPMDARRLECDPAQIDEYYNTLEALLHDIPAAMVISIDEIMHQDWRDAHREKASVPGSSEKATITIPIAGEVKRSTLLAGITAYGSSLNRLMVLLGDTCEAGLFQVSFTPDKALSASQENGFISNEA
jgi:hypothetical protein